MSSLQLYYVTYNGGAWFVKESAFFLTQGGLSQDWGRNWRPISAGSIEDARRLAPTVFGHKAVEEITGVKDTSFECQLSELLANECTQQDDHDPAPCPKCARMLKAILALVRACK